MPGDLRDPESDRSILRGPRPVFASYPTWDAGSIAVAVPERWMVAEVENRLGGAGILSCSIGADGPRLVDASVHVGTMHRFKGLEFQRLIIAGISEGLLSAQRITPFEETDPLCFRRETQPAPCSSWPPPAPETVS